MDLHLILAPGHAPEFATVETESKRLARERGGSARPVSLPDTKREFVPFINDLLVDSYCALPVELPPPPVTVKPIFHHEHDTSHLRGDCLPREAMGGYSSPFTAATTVQRIDGSMIAESIRQMTDAKALTDVLGAVISRLQAIKGE